MMSRSDQVDGADLVKICCPYGVFAWHEFYSWSVWIGPSTDTAGGRVIASTIAVALSRYSAQGGERSSLCSSPPSWRGEPARPPACSLRGSRGQGCADAGILPTADRSPSLGDRYSSPLRELCGTKCVTYCGLIWASLSAVVTAWTIMSNESRTAPGVLDRANWAIVARKSAPVACSQKASRVRQGCDCSGQLAVPVPRIFANPPRAESTAACATSENASPPTDRDVANRSSHDQLSAPVQITASADPIRRSATSQDVSPPAQYCRTSSALPWLPMTPC